MLKLDSNKTESGENNMARACDACQSTPCTIYCHADSAYLCTSCDAEVHSANRVASRHKRVQVCESCECAPAAFLCEADDASLCTTCDLEAHSANPLAKRHKRVPILPISGKSYRSMATRLQSETTMTNPENGVVVGREEGDEDTKETASWLLPNSDKNSDNHSNNNQNNGLLFSDEYPDLVDYNLSMDYKFTGQYDQQACNVPHMSYGGDGVVPLQLKESRGRLCHEQQNFELDMTYGSLGSHYSDNGPLNHNAYISSIETGVVPEPTARDTTTSHPRTPKGMTDQQHDPTSQMITQLSPLDREARVLRYREKKKTRKFEKTIRYASRKAYAERRPRINGRFAKREETEEAENQGFNLILMSDTSYSIAPSFSYQYGEK